MRQTARRYREAKDTCTWCLQGAARVGHLKAVLFGPSKIDRGRDGVMACETSNDKSDLTSKTVTELSAWLEEKGIPQEFCRVFEGKGKRFVLTFLPHLG